MIKKKAVHASKMLLQRCFVHSITAVLKEAQYDLDFFAASLRNLLIKVLTFLLRIYSILKIMSLFFSFAWKPEKCWDTLLNVEKGCVELITKSFRENK